MDLLLRYATKRTIAMTYTRRIEPIWWKGDVLNIV
jgi:hypothetical protein